MWNYLPSSTMRSLKTYVIAFACLVVGALLYALCRTDIWFVDSMHLNKIGAWHLPTDTVWGYWLVYCLPDGLWYLALLLVQQQMVYAKSVVSRAIFAAAIALPFVLEGLQAARLIPGTFDYMDILTYLLTLILFICLKKLF